MVAMGGVGKVAEVAAEDNVSLPEVHGRVRGMVTELAADYSTTTLRVLELILSWVWNRVYDGVQVHRIQRCREAASRGGVLYMAAHRSHMDYLLLSYVLYKEGLVPPHIAAGINLNFWPMGPILRRGGAFDELVAAASRLVEQVGGRPPWRGCSQSCEAAVCFVAVRGAPRESNR